MFNGLVKPDLASGKVVPDLATSWQYDGSGNLVFKIRKGVKFQNIAPVNGREMTVEDVRYSLDRIMDPDKNDPKAALRTNFPTVTAVQAVDSETIKLVLSAPDAELLSFVAHEQTVVVAPEAAIGGEYGDPKATIGTGPFIAKVVAPASGENRFERNPNYFVAGKPYLDGVNYLQNDNYEVRAAMLRTKQLDWTSLQNPADVTYFLARGGMKWSSVEGSFIGTEGLWFNTTIKPFSDIRLRKAINLGIDRSAITQAVYNGAASPLGPIGNAGAGGWDVNKIGSLPGFGIDKGPEIAQAKKLMAEAGVGAGFKFTVHTDPSYYDPTLAVIQAQLKKGLNVEIDIVRDSSYNYRFASYVKEKNAQAVYLQDVGVSKDHPLFFFYKCDGGRNQAQICNPELDKMIDLQRGTLNEAERSKLLDKIQQTIWDMQPAAYTVRKTMAYLAYDRVMGWFPPPDVLSFSPAQFQDIWLNN